jgi:hypothetical protein
MKQRKQRDWSDVTQVLPYATRWQVNQLLDYIIFLPLEKRGCKHSNRVAAVVCSAIWTLKIHLACLGGAPPVLFLAVAVA